MAEPVVLWRCTKCGKWSHAKRRPLRHTRTVVIEQGGECNPRCDNCAARGSGCGGASPTITAEVICGPFAGYVATPTGEVGPSLPEHGRVTVEDGWDVESMDLDTEIPF